MFNFKRFIRLTFTMVFIAGTIIAGLVTVAYFKITPASLDVTDNTPETPPDKNINVLLMGTDAENVRVDFIMLACYNPDDSKLSLISIPRDTKVSSSRIDNKINAAYIKGNETLIINDVQKITGVLPKYYVVINFRMFRTIVDLMGGIKIDVPINMNYDDPLQNLHIHISKGLQLLDGDKAEQFIRFRKNNDGTGYALGDLDRIAVQQKFLKEAVKQFVSPSNLLKINQVIKAVLGNLETNITLVDVTAHLKDALSIKKENVKFYTLPGEGRYIGDISYFIHDEQQTIDMVNNISTKTAEGSSTVAEAQYNNPVITKVNGNGNGSNTNTNTNSSSNNVTQPVAQSSKGSIEVLNATDIRGLAGRAAQKFTDAGYTVKKVGNYYSRYHVGTQIIKRTETINANDIRTLLGGATISTELEESAEVDATIILGADYKE